MRIISIFFVFFFGLLIFSSLGSATQPSVCTMEYAPVCSWSGGQKQIYSNNCVASSQGVSDATADSCSLIPVDRPVRPLPMGGEVDIYGCKSSTGYSWNSQLRECVRPWMTRTRLMNVLGDTVSCSGVSSLQCLQIKKRSTIELFDGSISGFTPVSGYTYRLLVREDKGEKTPADTQSTKYSLVRILSKIFVPVSK